MNRYLVRSLKYFTALIVMYVAFMYVMYLIGATSLTIADNMSVLFGTTRGRLLIVAVVVMSIIYPRISFISRYVEGDMKSNKDRIIAAFAVTGYELREERNGCMIFRGGLLQRLFALGEDEISVSQSGEKIKISGIRRTTVRVMILLECYIRNHNRGRYE